MTAATRLVLCQPPTGLAVSERLGWIETALAGATRTGETMAVFPELFLSGYTTSVADPAAAYACDREQLVAVQRLCEHYRAWVVVGAVTRDDAGYRNSAVCIDPSGNRLAVHHKCRPFGDAEERAFVPGDEPRLFDTPLGRTGMAVCFDIEDPALIADYAAQGADTILVPTANMRPYTLVPDVKVRARALDNQLLVAYANHTGQDGDLDFPGDSLIVDAEGNIAGKLGQRPGVLAIAME
ncbi:nitrilase-related carbon-nitrogen hydrolase [Aidingimonas halophila]|uniref:Predicted amidohydrolase n=1 Tax=Aidingimonas halophila TaxID=574349 RepID=A0A1H3CN31_9GAMM|nr:nitrilase-related carbon-nitrogen hydrolase [Aidingimonas halophila]GHC35282.1 hydrolase [Aidingimonas halophila]SDX54849.1 Predicted amidohydrolase [Aidingimonas halophila]